MLGTDVIYNFSHKSTGWILCSAYRKMEKQKVRKGKHVAQGLRTGSGRGRTLTHPPGAPELELFAPHLWPPFLVPVFQTPAAYPLWEYGSHFQAKRSGCGINNPTFSFSKNNSTIQFLSRVDQYS